MPDLITGGFTGRMGNQMFQIAAVMALALKHNVDYSFQRPTDNDAWNVYFNHFPNLIIEDKDRNYYNEGEYVYREIPYEKGVLCLSGFFQSEKYFIDYRKDILEAFEPALGKWEMIKGKVSIHVRRTDYVINSPFEPVTIEYISKAITFFENKGYSSFMVFSDDMAWCRDNVNAESFDDCGFEYSEGDEYYDMGKMSCCEHNIIANSTFSWWGAWLNRNPDKIVIAPEEWFDGVNKDLLPEKWITL